MADAITGDSATWEVTTWPWPRVWFLEYYTLVVALVESNLHLFELYCTTGNVWVADDVQDLGVASYITQVEVAESGPFYIISTYGKNGTSLVINSYRRNPGSGAPLITALPNSYIPEHIAVCNYNGQFLIGGIEPGTNTKFGDMAYNTVAWSQIGRVNFDMSDNDTRTAFYMNMPWGEWSSGLVLKLKKLGNNVIVYGDGGKGALRPVTSPMVTYGYQSLQGFGVRSGNHVAGDVFIHGFIDANYEWCTMEPDLVLKRHGYKEFMKGLVDNGTTIVSYDPQNQRFYISNGVTGYSYDKSGLSTTRQLVTSVGNYRGKTLCGFFKTASDNEYRFVTDTYDFGTRGIKTVETVEFGVDAPIDLYAAVDYRYDKNDSFTRSDWKILNKRGSVVLMVSAPEFRFCLKGASFADVNVDYIRVEYKMSDKTMLRARYDYRR